MPRGPDPNMMRTGRLGRALDRCIDGMAVLAGLLLVYQFVSITADVMVRLIFDRALNWVVYTNEWSILVIAFLGAAWLQREKGHVRVDILTSVMGQRLLCATGLIRCLIAIGASAALTWYGSAVTIEKYQSNVYDFFKVDYVPIYVVYIVIPAGSLVLFMQSLRDLRAEIRSLRALTDR